jgi:hypothetical protein
MMNSKQRLKELCTCTSIPADGDSGLDNGGGDI